MEDITRCYTEIVWVSESHDSLSSVFNCLRSTNNSTFKVFVKQVEQDASFSSDAYNCFASEMLMATVASKYKNKGEAWRLEPV